MHDLRNVRVLQAVAQLGTVTAAAEALHVTPSAASQQVRKLERELGVALFERHGRGIRLSAAAWRLIDVAEEIDTRWREVKTDMHGSDGEPTGSVRLCGAPTEVSTLLRRTAAVLGTRHPELVVRLREAEAVECFFLVTTGEADLAVVESAPGNPTVDDRAFDQQPLLDDPLDLLVSADHPAARRGDLHLTDVADLADEPWVVGAPGSSARRHVVTVCTAAGFAPIVAHEARDWGLVATLVAHGLGIAFVPRLAQLPAQLAVTRLPLRGGPIPSRRLLLCTRRGSRRHPNVSAAEHALHEAVGKPPGPPT